MTTETPRRALLFGEALIDCFPDRRVVAGAPLHVAVHLAARGWDAALVSRVGEDGDGRRILAELAGRRVRTDLVEHDAELPTGTVSIALDDDGGHAFTIHRPVAWDAIEGPRAWPAHDVVVFGSLAARAPRSRATWERLLAEPTPLRVFDVNLRPPDVSAAVLRRGLDAAHLLKLNADERSELGRLLGIGVEPFAWIERHPGLAWVCVTLGSDGAELYARDGTRTSIGGAAADAVDTVGAGDAFTAGLVDGLARGLGPAHALEGARALAATVLGVRGGLPRR